MNIQTVKLDVTKRPTVVPVIIIGQGDKNGTTLVADIYNAGEAMDLTGLAVSFAMKLPDESAYYNVAGSVDGSTATFTIDERYAGNVSGITDTAYVNVIDGDSVICSTNRMRVVVLEDALDGVDPSRMYDNGLLAAIQRANDAAEAAEGVVLQDVPLMSSTVRGGAQLGSGLTIDDGVLGVDVSTVDDGELSVLHGGTGASTAAGARSAIGAAASSHTHAASTDLTGQVPIANGGTGASTAAAARTALGAASASDLDDAEQAIADNAADIATLQESVSPSYSVVIPSTESNITIRDTSSIHKHGFMMSLNVGFTTTESVSNGTKVATIASGYRPVSVTVFPIAGSTAASVTVSSNGSITYYGASPIASGSAIWVRGCYVLA